MLETVAPEIWFVSLVLACTLGWLLGNRRSVRHDGGSRKAGHNGGEPDRFFTLVVCDQTDHLHETLHKRGSLVLRSSRGGRAADQCAQVPRAQNRLTIFSDMPSLADLHADTAAIRREHRVWEAPDLGEQITAFLGELDAGAVQTLDEYRASIAALAHTEARHALRCEANQPSLPSARV